MIELLPDGTVQIYGEPTPELLLSAAIARTRYESLNPQGIWPAPIGRDVIFDWDEVSAEATERLRRLGG